MYVGNTHFPTSFPESEDLAAIPDGTIIGPVLKVRNVEIIDGYGTQIAIPSFVRSANTSYVVISRETALFVNEIRDHKEELRSSNELLTAKRKLVLPIASKKLVRALAAILLVKERFAHTRTQDDHEDCLPL